MISKRCVPDRLRGRPRGLLGGVMSRFCYKNQWFFNDFEIHALKLLEMKTSKYFEILTDEVDKVVKWNVKSDEIILNSILKQINN